ncbi:MAG: ATP synthase F1 subunit alpha, F-type H+-transporting ATPase subunit alpha [Candidatus Gottesmanbacteria bacterium GW2011_GWA2_43_14]|uniref:ATP synthase F1 subunit alpha, F-type H+-transporting ATPase subunit alpha n=1 Tax=Candidatus Gottesmanbacteria bacterium GW2011_GWA2_43_14 TaxID=1618443 RepID=A0A0G1DCY2_9BACT|nr:MAG: ATP synthase F1 subunit alpha, F-type H+-transporting ATPase subunit alpha [Candidatus Gottesmanbacteria bacterium GW2011_GWA2_43_14]
MKTSKPTVEVGFVVKAQDYLVYLEGLPAVKIEDIVISREKGRAIVTALDHEKIEILMLDKQRPGPGDAFSVDNRGILIPSENKLLGRAINPLGNPIDGKPGFEQAGEKVNFGVVAPGIDSRKIITDQLYTGITLVDTLLPIGKGQRELLFGEPRSGKTFFMSDMILNQKGKNIICIYVAMGKSDLDVKKFINNLESEGGLNYTVVVAATSSDSAPLISIAPAVGLSIAENFARKGRDVLIILDDLGMHAKYLREIGLLSGRVPGRESYPADIFYAHSHLVERAGNFNERYGNSSITLLPVIETDMENFTNLIPTNVMSMTDGHILFSAVLRSQGFYPSIDPDRSVTRVGHQTQRKLHKILADKVRSLIANYHELERFGRFGSELTGETQKLLKQGLIALELLKQEQLERIDPSTQILMLTLLYTSFFDNKDLEFVKKNKKKLIEFLKSSSQSQIIGNKIMTIDLPTLIAELSDILNLIDKACQP